MPINEHIASKIVEALQDAAACAKERAKSEQLIDPEFIQFPAFRIPPDTRDKPALVQRLQTLWLANLLRDSIDSCADTLQGLIWLAASQHERGVDSLGRGIGYRTKNVWEKYSDIMRIPVACSLNRLENEDLPALREHRKVQTGLFARVYAGMMWDAIASPYLGELLTAFDCAKYDVAAELEA